MKAVYEGVRQGARCQREHNDCRSLIWIGTPTLRWVALGIYAFAAITDILDGYLARSMNQQSSLGRLFDPIADKLLVGGCLLVLCAFGYITEWSVLSAVIILLREILVSGLREYLAEIRVVFKNKPFQVTSKMRNPSPVGLQGIRERLLGTA